jgi:hypothetical protein
MSTRFSDLPSSEAIKLLSEMGDDASVNALSGLLDANPSLRTVNLADLPESEQLAMMSWRGTEHSYGYIEFDADKDLLDIRPATTITADASLKGQQVNIKLGSLYTMSYPGYGRHNVLMHFRCKHAKADGSETQVIEFEQKFKSRDGEGAGNIGDFIFLGLRVPANGLQFEVQTVNINNDADEAALQVLESDTIKNGLDLANTSFAALAPFTKMAQGVLSLLLTRNRNKVVQQFTIGFDFDAHSVEIAKLCLGTYVVAQAKRDELPWDQWVFQRSTGLVVRRSDNSERLDRNHITFNVLKHDA